MILASGEAVGTSFSAAVTDVAVADGSKNGVGKGVNEAVGRGVAVWVLLTRGVREGVRVTDGGVAVWVARRVAVALRVGVAVCIRVCGRL